MTQTQVTSVVPPRPKAFTLPRRVHFLGAGGAGVSGIARILAARGLEVSGHDRADSQLFDELSRTGLRLTLGESKGENLPDEAELVVRSAAVSTEDPQVVAAVARGVPVKKYAEILPLLAPPERSLAVAGTHGKTTVSWMLWHVLEGIAEVVGAPVPGAIVGGLCRRLRTNALAGSRDGWFCFEACEYDRSFLHLAPRGAIVTNVEEDHLDYYETLENLQRAFACFLDEVADDGLIVLGRQVPREIELGGRATEIWRMGEELDVDLFGEERGCFAFRLRGPGWATRAIQLAVPGHFNVENAGLALGLALGLMGRHLRRDPRELLEGAARGIERFQGVHRRFEPWGESGGVEVVHDYAHHPTEVRVTIEAALRAFPGRPLHVYFQPHQFSRTARFLVEFADSLRAAHRVVVGDVYGARQHIDGERHAGAPELVRELKLRHVDAVEGGGLGEATRALISGLPRKGPAAVLVLGAGDVELVKENLMLDLASRT